MHITRTAGVAVTVIVAAMITPERVVERSPHDISLVPHGHYL